MMTDANNSKQIKSLTTRARKAIAQLAAGDYADSRDCTALMIRVNALTLKLDRLGATELADAFSAQKSAAVEAGRQARKDASEAAVKQARDAHYDAMRNDPAAWMRR